MKKKILKHKAERTKSEINTEVKNELKEKPRFQILGQTGGDYINTKLPENFFKDLLFGEMALEYDFSMDNMSKLMELYSIGIQYYLENNPIQAKYFQDRMGFILTNKDTLSNLKKQQEEEEKERNENKKKEEKKKYPKSEKNLPKVISRQRAKTNFLFKAQAVKKEDIKKKVTFVLNDTKKIKEEKENLKNIIKEDLNKQNMQWKEKLKKKREDFNSAFGFTRPRNRTTFITKRKTFQTPGPSENRGIMSLNSPINPKSPNEKNSGFDSNKKSNLEKNNNFANNIDNESSENDELEKNEGDIDVLNQLKKRHKNEEKKEKDNKKDDDIDSDSESYSSSKSKNSEEFLKKIDEVEEEKEPTSLRQTARSGELNKNKNEEKNEIKENEIKENDNKENNDEIKDNDNKNENEKKENENSISKESIENKDDNPQVKKRTSIVEEKNLLREIDLEEDITNAIEEKMKKIENLNNINNNTNDKDDEETNEGQTDEISSISNNNIANPIQDLRLTIEEIPLKFQEAYTEVEIKMNRYVKDLNEHFFKDTFEHFSLELKELYDKKYQKYVDVNNEYHASITEKEYQLDNDKSLNEEQKIEVQQIIESLKEEQKDQIDKIIDEYNHLIDSKIRDFKQTYFKNDCGINLMEEQLKLDVYTMINEAFY